MTGSDCWQLSFYGRCELSRYLRAFAPRRRGARLLVLAEIGLYLERGVLGLVPGDGPGWVPVAAGGSSRFRVRVKVCPTLQRVFGGTMEHGEFRRLCELGLAALSGRIRAGGISALSGEAEAPRAVAQEPPDRSPPPPLRSEAAEKADHLLMSY